MKINNLERWVGLIRKQDPERHSSTSIKFTRPGFLTLDTRLYPSVDTLSARLVLERSYEINPNIRSCDPTTSNRLVVPYSKLDIGTYTAHVFIQDGDKEVAYDKVNISILPPPIDNGGAGWKKGDAF